MAGNSSVGAPSLAAAAPSPSLAIVDPVALAAAAAEEAASLAFERRVGIIVPLIFAAVVVVGVVGNVLVISVVAVNRQMRNSTNSLVMNLGVSDLLFLVFCVPFTAAQLSLGRFPCGDVCCGAVKTLQFGTAYGSVWTLVLLALDRYMAVAYPVKALKYRTVRNVGFLLGLLWTTIFAFAIPVYGTTHQIYRYQAFGQNRSACINARLLRQNLTVGEVRRHYFTFNALAYACPLVISCLLYIGMLRRLWTLPVPGLTTGTSYADRIRAKKRITIMATGVIVTFAVCWAPQNICFFLLGFTYPQKPGGTLYMSFQIFALVLAYTNACVNPILYSFLSDNFRKGFVKILTALLILCRCRAAPRPDYAALVRRRGAVIERRHHTGRVSGPAISPGGERVEVMVSFEPGREGNGSSSGEGVAGAVHGGGGLLGPPTTGRVLVVQVQEPEFESSPAAFMENSSECARRGAESNFLSVGHSLRELFELSHVEISHSVNEAGGRNN